MTPMNLFHEAKYRESLAPLLSQKAVSMSGQRVLAWQDIKGTAPTQPREYLLRAITGVTLSKRHADRFVFGTALTPRERGRDYLRRDGEPFDLFLMDCLYDFYGTYNAHEMSTTIREWEDTLSDIIQEVHSRKQAREMLIDAWLDAHGPYYKNYKTSFWRDDSQPAF
jgi:hypothetical protein